MGKKVQYAIGAVGLVPALGLLAQPAAGASAHASAKPALTSGKSVNATSCTGRTEHQSINHGVILTFWSAPVGSRTCIGTIEVSKNSTSKVGAFVNNAFGNFCVRSAGGGHITYGCHRVFRRNGLRVRAFSAGLDGTRHYFSVPL